MLAGLDIDQLLSVPRPGVLQGLAMLTSVSVLTTFLSLSRSQDWWHFGRSSHLSFGGCENKATVIVEELRLLSPAVRIEKAAEKCGRPDISFAKTHRQERGQARSFPRFRCQFGRSRASQVRLGPPDFYYFYYY